MRYERAKKIVGQLQRLHQELHSILTHAGRLEASYYQSAEDRKALGDDAAAAYYRGRAEGYGIIVYWVRDAMDEATK